MHHTCLIVLALAVLSGTAGCLCFDDGPEIWPNERQIASDHRRLDRGQPMRYHRDERELRHHQRDVESYRWYESRRN